TASGSAANFASSVPKTYNVVATGGARMGGRVSIEGEDVVIRHLYGVITCEAVDSIKMPFINGAFLPLPIVCNDTFNKRLKLQHTFKVPVISSRFYIDGVFVKENIAINFGLISDEQEYEIAGRINKVKIEKRGVVPLGDIA